MKAEHLSTDKPAKSKDEMHDRQLEDSFPAGDPPSFTPGAVGAPKRRESKTSLHHNQRKSNDHGKNK